MRDRDLGLRPDRRDRRAQLVRRVAGEALHAGDGLVASAQQPVELLREGTQLVARGRDRQPLTRRQRRRRGPQPVDGAQRRPRPHPRGSADQHRGAQRAEPRTRPRPFRAGSCRRRRSPSHDDQPRRPVRAAPRARRAIAADRRAATRDDRGSRRPAPGAASAPQREGRTAVDRLPRRCRRPAVPVRSRRSRGCQRPLRDGGVGLALELGVRRGEQRRRQQPDSPAGRAASSTTTATRPDDERHPHPQGPARPPSSPAHGPGHGTATAGLGRHDAARRTGRYGARQRGDGVVRAELGDGARPIRMITGSARRAARNDRVCANPAIMAAGARGGGRGGGVHVRRAAGHGDPTR